MNNITPHYFFDLTHFEHAALFDGCEFAYDALSKISAYIATHGNGKNLGTTMEGARVEPGVTIGKGTIIQPGAWVRGPAIIGENCEIRHGAYVGAQVIIGNNAVVGHASEINHSVLMNGARAAHFAFVGNSIVGNNVNLGAGVKLANVKITGTEIAINNSSTGLTKLGAIIGDESSLGCNSVTQPGTLIGKNVLIYPLALVRGAIPEHTILKVHQTHHDEPIHKKQEAT